MNNTNGYVKNLDLSIISQLVNELNTGYIDNDLFINMEFSKLGSQFLSIGQPYLLGEGRVMRIISGKALAMINLVHQQLEPQMCFIIPNSSIFEIEKLSDDFKLQVFSFEELPMNKELDYFSAFYLNESEWKISESYFNLIWQESQCKPVNMYVIKQLQLAFLSRFESYYNTLKSETSNEKDNPKSKLFHQFFELVNQYGTQEHFIGFYANEIGVTPNHLGSVVKGVSGATCRELINRNLIMRSKIMLKYSNRPSWMIADELNFPNASAFSKFFKREVGMTPLSYRNL